MPDTSQRTPPRVRVVVLNWNSWWFTRRCLRSLAATDHPADRLEVVLVDNGSIDGSLERLCHEFTGVTVVRNGANLGFAEGCNRAMRDLDGVDMVALVNNDAVVEPGWLAALLAALDEHPHAGAAAARLVLEPAFGAVSASVHGGPLRVRSVRVDGAEATTRTRFEGSVRTEGRTEWPMELEHHLEGDVVLRVPAGEGSHLVELTVEGTGRIELTSADRQDSAELRGGVATLRVTLGDRDERVELLNGLGTARNEVAESYDLHFGEPDDPTAVPELAGPAVPVTGFSGGGVLLRAEMLREVGLFDPAFFAYYEDSDLSWRAARAGWGTVAAPGAVIRHAFGGSGGSRAPGFFFLNYRNWLLTVLRNAEGEQRRAALASARTRIRWAVRANVASPLRHRRAPSWALVGAWARTVAGVIAVRRAQRHDPRPPGSVRTDRVRAAWQPEFTPRGPSARPGGPPLVLLDLTEAARDGGGPAARLLADMSGAARVADVVPVVRDGDRWRRASPRELGTLLQVPGPYREATSAELELAPGDTDALDVLQPAPGSAGLVLRPAQPAGTVLDVPDDPAALLDVLAASDGPDPE